MRSVGAVIALLLAAALALPAATLAATGAKVSKKAGETWEAVKSFSVERKNDAVALGKQLVDGTSARIAELEREAVKAKGEARRDIDRQIVELKVKRRQAAAQLEKMRDAGGAAWEQTRNGFADAYRDLHSALQKAFTRPEK